MLRQIMAARLDSFDKCRTSCVTLTLLPTNASVVAKAPLAEASNRVMSAQLVWLTCNLGQGLLLERKWSGIREGAGVHFDAWRDAL